ncbi:MAG: ribosomal protein S18-alanine N-acetyltransferase [Actinomycetaceae bacterium]|nr:ribosomal protein S18-alanine N-acetyltransferase [Actinomycetaceae bacterium]
MDDRFFLCNDVSMQIVRLDASWMKAVLTFDQRIFSGVDMWNEKMWSDVFSSHNEYVWAIVTKSEGMQIRGDICALGVVSLGIEPEILTFAVSPAWRNKGLGKKLLAHLCEEVRKEKHEELFLEVRALNDIAISLYSSGGFQVVGRRKGYYKDDDALIMKKLFSY